MSSYDTTESSTSGTDNYQSAVGSSDGGSNELSAAGSNEGSSGGPSRGSFTEKEFELDLPPNATETVISSLFSGILLAYWDNIMGPRVKRLWLGDNHEKFNITQETINFVSSHTLNGELCRVREEGSVDTKFYVLPDRGYLFSAFIFTGESKSGKTIFSLSLILAYSELDCYLTLQQLLSQRLKVLITKYRIFQEKDLPTAAENFSSHLRQFVSSIESLKTSGLPSYMCIKNTVLSSVPESVKVKGLLDSKFLMRAITSHLQTGGSTVVVGESPDLINLIVNTLSIFLSPSERGCSRYAVGKTGFSYDRDFFLQGLIKAPNEDYPISSKDVILSSYPTTLIDIDTMEVKQTGPIHHHCSTRQEFLKIELSLLYEGKEAPLYPTIGLFRNSDDIAIMVQHFVSEMFVLPNLCSVRETYTDNFMRILNQKAQTLLSYVEAKSLYGFEILDHNDLLQLKQDLVLTSEADFRIVLAWTEKLRTGFVTFLFGDPRKTEARYQAIRKTFVEAI